MTEKLVKAPSGRVKRTGLGTRNRLSVKGKDPNYEYRIVNDTDDRVADFMDRGWEIDTSEEVRVGSALSRVDQASQVGKPKDISVGGGQRAVLMRIRKDWYLEDQAAKDEYVKATEQAMRPNPNDGTYGEGLKITRK